MKWWLCMMWVYFLNRFFPFFKLYLKFKTDPKPWQRCCQSQLRHESAETVAFLNRSRNIFIRRLTDLIKMFVDKKKKLYSSFVHSHTGFPHFLWIRHTHIFTWFTHTCMFGVKRSNKNAYMSPSGLHSLCWEGSSGRALGEKDTVDRGQNHKCGMSHGQTELIYDWSGSTSAAWWWGSRMSGMGVRSGSRFSLSIISGIGGRLCLARGI